MRLWSRVVIPVEDDDRTCGRGLKEMRLNGRGKLKSELWELGGDDD